VIAVFAVLSLVCGAVIALLATKMDRSPVPGSSPGSCSACSGDRHSGGVPGYEEIPR
jgi:hypothetical protein